MMQDFPKFMSEEVSPEYTFTTEDYDQLVIGGVATLNGTLNVSLYDNGSGIFVPQVGQSFTIWMQFPCQELLIPSTCRVYHLVGHGQYCMMQYRELLY